ncbi:MAG TPA: N-acetylmuramoyl-L-alanine amidase [Terriglobales bacterium]
MAMLFQTRGRVLAALVLVALMTVPAGAAPARTKKQQALAQFQQAEKMREALNGLPTSKRTRTEYQRVIDAYRRVYYLSPTSMKADPSVVAVAELMAEMGHALDDEKALRDAIGQYEFLRREYPGSASRVDALFTIGQIYKEDLNEPDKAKEAFQELLKHYPNSDQADEARAAIKDIDHPVSAKNAKKEKPKEPERASIRVIKEKQEETPEPKSHNALVTGIRHWSTPDYTRVAVDLEEEVKYEAGRVPNPDRIFFDLQDTKLASTLVGKTFDVSDGFLKKIRVAQFERGTTRIVLEVDDVSDYSAFLLPNPYRLIIDIHGKQPQRTTNVARNTAKPEKENKSESTPKSVESAKASDKKADATVSAKKPDTGKSKSKTDDDYAEEESPKASAKSEKQIPKPAVVDKPAEKVETAKLNPPVVKITDKPTSEPVAESVSPRGKSTTPRSTAHAARPTSDGDTSLIRALGLKIGRIVVDAGHGGHDTGTIGPTGLLEKDLTLDVALRLGKMLESRMGAEVVYTRDDDTFIPLETRTAIANEQQADLFISIHANSSRDIKARGVETYYLNFTSSADALEVAARENSVSDKSIHELQDLVKKIALKEKIEESREFASDVQRQLHSGLAAKAPAIRDRGVKKAPFIVLIGANMPSILAEISFISNPVDERRLQTKEYRQKIAESLYKGIARYVSGLSGVKVASKGNSSVGQQ